MHSQRRYIILMLLFFFALSSPAFSSQEALNEDRAALISVQYIGVDLDMETITQLLDPSESLLGDVTQSLSFQIHGSEKTLENCFLLRPQQPVLLEFFTVDGFSDQGIPLPGQLLAEHKLQVGDVFLFRHLVPEGMPNLLLCAQDETGRYYWHPRFSGMDGSLELNQGFIHFTGQ
ncbi:MAG: hypothetical protein RBR42_08040 [Desulfomicrobium sp.]|nr:hypothetical protein [Desulfomicrobium sp.]NLV97068.1 hypothetical protein [Desulfovibrionales bacterium]